MQNILEQMMPWLPVIAAVAGAFVGGVVGALGAFAVSRINERIKRNRRRWGLHRNALVAVEHRLNETLGILGDNVVTAERVIRCNVSMGGPIRVFWDEPQALPRHNMMLAKFLRLDLMNELLSFDQKVRKLNQDVSNIRAAYQEARAAVYRKDSEKTQYLRSLGEYQDLQKQLLKGYALMREVTTSVLARVRCTNRSDRLHDKKSFLRLPKLDAISSESVKKEKDLLTSEIDELRRRSRAEIEMYFGQTELPT